jgi:glycosyltransferase involved in cell wall biosynthesis
MKVLLVSNRVFHYRIEVYNYFRNSFLKHNIQLEVLADEIQQSDEQAEFPLQLARRSYPAYRSKIGSIDPDVVIFFLHLKNTSIFPLYWYCRRKNIRIIFWGHGINLGTPNDRLKQMVYNYLHKKSDAIILYAPEQLKFIKPAFHSKTHIALNTINFHSLPSVEKSKKELRDQYGLKFKTIVLFCGRVNKNKRVDMLIDIFTHLENKTIGLLIVGGGLSEEDQTRVNNQDNIIYYGAVYEPIQVNELHKLSDIFCIPGKCGLGINLAMYWSLPVLTTDVIHAPEIHYLKHGVNGFITKDKQELTGKIELLAEDQKLLKELSGNARSIINREADISNMSNAFMKAIDFVMQEKQG